MQKFSELQQLHALVTQWGTDRNFYAVDGATYNGQWLKMYEESGELALGIAKGKPDVIKDSLGDMVVVAVALQNLAEQVGQLTRIHNFSLFDRCTGEKPSSFKDPHELVFNLASDILWLSNANTSTTGKGLYLQRLVAHIETAAYFYGFTLLECLEHSYNEIKDRKGQMVKGVFIKESDLTK